MRKLLIMIFATAALALPVAASAHGWHHPHGLFTKLSGTGSSFAGASATASGSVAGESLASGTFAATLTTDWSHATTKTGEHGTLACAPASLSLTLTETASSANTTSSTVTGRTCAWTKSDGTVFRGFFGHGSVTGEGALSGITGMERVFLTQKADGTVHGAVFAGFGEVLAARFTAQKHDAEHKTGNCNGH